MAAELVRLRVDVLFTYTTPGTLAAKGATTTIPIVMVTSSDAVATGLVASLARPGGNVTGLTFMGPELYVKQLELLKAAVPGLKRVARLVNPDNSSVVTIFKEAEHAAASMKIEVSRLEARNVGDVDAALTAAARNRVDAIAVSGDPVFSANAKTIADIAVKRRLPRSGTRSSRRRAAC